MTTLTEVLSQVKLFLAKKKQETCMPPPFSQLHLVQSFTKILHQTTAHLLDKKVMTVIPWGPWLPNMLKFMVMAGASLDVLLLF